MAASCGSLSADRPNCALRSFPSKRFKKPCGKHMDASVLQRRYWRSHDFWFQGTAGGKARAGCRASDAPAPEHRAGSRRSFAPFHPWQNHADTAELESTSTRYWPACRSCLGMGCATFVGSSFAGSQSWWATQLGPFRPSRPASSKRVMCSGAYSQATGSNCSSL